MQAFPRHLSSLTPFQVYEQSRFANETGSAIHLVPNGLSVLHHLGVPAEEHGANEITSVRLPPYSGSRNLC